MKKMCKFCFREYETNNKHRTKCYECYKKYPPYVGSQGSTPFNRFNVMKKDKFSKLENPNKI